MGNKEITNLIHNSIRNNIYWYGDFEVEDILKQSYFRKEQEFEVKTYVRLLKESYDSFLRIYESISLCDFDGKLYAGLGGATFGGIMGYAFDSPGLGAIVGGTLGLVGEVIKKPISNFLKTHNKTKIQKKYFDLILDSPRDPDKILGLYEN